MVFKGISRVFCLTNNEQFETIGQFWNEMAMLYGLEHLQGLGYNWNENTISYAIGLKNSDIKDYNVTISLPEEGWECLRGKTECLEKLYDEIYKGGSLRFEMETFYENGTCEIRYYRAT